MNPNYLDISERKKLIADIKSYENQERKKKSLKDYEVYNDSAYDYVYDTLMRQLGIRTVEQMPIVSNLNIAKAVVNKEATIYTDDPLRTYEDINDQDVEALKKLYKDCKFNSLFGKSNKYYKLRNQAFLQVVPKQGKLKLRVLQPHNIDVVPDYLDPEQAFAYVISTFDKSIYTGSGKQDAVNQSIADAEDYKAKLERYQVWTNEYTLVMDGKGNVIGDILENPIGMLPFVDVSKDKDFEFFVRVGQALTQFTIDFNAAWSDLMYIARLQGYSIGVLKGDADLKPDSITIGPAKFLFLAQNPLNPDSTMDFDFKNPTPNIEASLKAIESLIALFLSTRGIDIKTIAVSGQNTFSSALEKLLAMIDQFKATKEDFDLYGYVEKEIHKIVTKYLSLLSGTTLLERDYWVTPSVEASKLTVTFKEPQMVETTSEKLANSRTKIDLGISDKVKILAEIDGISEDAAEEQILAIEERRLNMLARIAGGTGDASKTALNGAQVASLVEIVSKVAAGLLPVDSAEAMIMRSFNVSQDEAKEILGAAGKGFTIDPGQLTGV
jgi:hypothetical protein